MEASTANGSRDRRLSTALGTACIAALIFVASIVLHPWPDTLFAVDFVSFWTGGSLVRQGTGPALFDMARQRDFQVGLRVRQATADAIQSAPGFNPFHSPPPLALLFAPLTLLPMPLAYLLWSGLSLLGGLAAVALPLRGRPLSRTTAVVLLSFAATGDAIISGQVDEVFLLAFSLALLALSSRRPTLAGALLGILWLKPQYAGPFALLFLVKGRWRELFGMAAAGLVVAALSLAMVGLEGVVEYLEVLRRIGGFYPPSSELINADRMVNWRALLMHVSPGISGDLGSSLMLLLGGATLVVSLLAFRGEFEPASPRFARQMLVLALATIVTAPHSHFHGAMLLLAPLALVVARPMPVDPLRWVWPPLLGLGYLLGLVVWPAEGWRWFMALYFLLAMGLLTCQILVASRSREEVGGIPVLLGPLERP